MLFLSRYYVGSIACSEKEKNQFHFVHFSFNGCFNSIVLWSHETVDAQLKHCFENKVEINNKKTQKVIS